MKQDVKKLVEKFRLHGNTAYVHVSLYFRPLCRNWHRHLSKRIKMDYDTFASEFEETLYNSLLKYQDEHMNDKGDITPFEHYFTSAVRKRVSGLKRTFMSKKRKLERKVVTFSLHQHDVPDTSATHVYQSVDVLDIIRKIGDRRDQSLILFKLQGFTISEICRRLEINRREFWTRINNLRSGNSLLQVA